LPVHVLAINALGPHLLDYLQFEDLLPLCESARRWSFFCVIARSGCLTEPVLPSIRSRSYSEAFILVMHRRAARPEPPWS
jgi:hypothetical protein